MTIEDCIRRYGIELHEENLLRINDTSIPSQDLAWVRDNKPQIIAELNHARDREACKVEFYVHGYESHKVTVYPCDPLNNQFAAIARMFPEDCTAESVKNDYARATKQDVTPKTADTNDVAAGDITTDDTSNDAPADHTVLRANNFFGGVCVIKFDENGYTIVKNTTVPPCVSYLHITEDSSASVTNAVQNQLIKYFYQHPSSLPALGATPQDRYLKGVSIKERERVAGVVPGSVYYNAPDLNDGGADKDEDLFAAVLQKEAAYEQKMEE